MRGTSGVLKGQLFELTIYHISSVIPVFPSRQVQQLPVLRVCSSYRHQPDSGTSLGDLSLELSTNRGDPFEEDRAYPSAVAQVLAS